MACSVCGKKGHDIRACPVNAESEKVKLELALTQRRYLLESIRGRPAGRRYRINGGHGKHTE